MNLISIDFWNTIVVAHTNGEERHKARYDALIERAAGYNESLTKDRIDQAHTYASQRFDEIWIDEQRTPNSPELVAFTLEKLGIRFSENETAEITRIYEESLMDGPPDLAPGVADAVKHLSEKYKLAIISDTMFSPGRVLREFLHGHDILQYFSAFSFSDEVGVSKPHPKMYKKVLSETGTGVSGSFHIGDMQRTDITGAKAMGMGAILYTGVNESDKDQTTADHVLSEWDNIAELLIK